MDSPRPKILVKIEDQLINIREEAIFVHEIKVKKETSVPDDSFLLESKSVVMKEEQGNDVIAVIKLQLGF